MWTLNSEESIYTIEPLAIELLSRYFQTVRVTKYKFTTVLELQAFSEDAVHMPAENIQKTQYPEASINLYALQHRGGEIGALNTDLCRLVAKSIETNRILAINTLILL